MVQSTNITEIARTCFGTENKKQFREISHFLLIDIYMITSVNLMHLWHQLKPFQLCRTLLTSFTSKCLCSVTITQVAFKNC